MDEFSRKEGNMFAALVVLLILLAFALVFLVVLPKGNEAYSSVYFSEPFPKSSEPGQFEVRFVVENMEGEKGLYNYTVLVNKEEEISGSAEVEAGEKRVVSEFVELEEGDHKITVLVESSFEKQYEIFAWANVE